MIAKGKHFEREQVAGMVILIGLIVLIMTIIGMSLLDVRVQKIELADGGMYTIITEKGPVNVAPGDVLRIERTYTKAAFTGKPVELDKVYTTKGFIYFSSLDDFASVGQHLINSVDFEGKQVWVKPTHDDADLTPNQKSNLNLEMVRPLMYAIGTPSTWVPYIFLLLSLQNIALVVSGVALVAFIFPLRLEEQKAAQISLHQDNEFRSADEQLTAVAK